MFSCSSVENALLDLLEQAWTPLSSLLDRLVKCGCLKFFVSREQTSYLPPIYSLKIAPTNFGTMFIPFKTRLRFMGETLSKACFTSTSKEQTTNPNSSLLLSHSCCQESHGKYLRRTSSFFSKPWVWVSFQFSFSPSTCLSAKIPSLTKW